MNKLLSLILLMTTALMGMQVATLEQTDHRLQLQLEFQQPDMAPYTLETTNFELPHWSDSGLAFDSSSDQLVPYYSIPILLPPTGQLPELQVTNPLVVTDTRLPALTLSPELLKTAAGGLTLEGDQLVTLVQGEDFRDWHTARILIFPYAHSGQRLTHVTLALEFPETAAGHQQADASLAQHFVNGKMAANWQVTRPPALHRSVAALPSGQWYRLPINTMGIYRITTASFGGNVPAGDPANWQVYAPYFEGRSLPFALSNTEPEPPNLKAISISGVGLEDGILSGTDELRFFAQPLNGDFKGNNFTHLYGRQRYYWLCAPAGAASAPPQVTELPSSNETPDATLTSYEKRFYHEAELHNQLHSGESWVGEKLTGKSDQFTLIVNDNYLDLSAEIKLNALLIADYDAGSYQHQIAVELNGVPLSTTVTTSPYYKTIGVSGLAGENMLQDGNNVLSLKYTSNSANSIVYVDSLRLAYSRQLAPATDYLFGTVKLTGSINRLIFQDIPADFQVWDISNPSQISSWDVASGSTTIAGTGLREIIGFSPDQVQNAIAESAPDLGSPILRSPDHQADYLIITPDIFMDQAERIRELREESVDERDQLNVEIVNIADIYNEFSAGTLDPAAIKNFLHYVFWNWNTPRLHYVLFLGDADFDYRNITGQSKLIIPTFEQDGASDVGSYATDDKYTFLGSGIWDDLPDIAIGRLPAQTPDQLEIMVNKIIQYELTPEPGIWRNSITLVADDPLRPSKRVEAEHINDTEDLVRVIPASMQVNKVYLTEYPEVQDPNSPYIKKPKARDDFLQKLYDGTLLVNYFGHGSPNVWAQEEVFTASDLGRVKTGMQLPFWIAGTCDWAKYDDVNSSCVPEELMLQENNGAVGILSTTRKTYSTFNNALLTNFFDFLFPDSESSRSISVGDAIMLAKNISSGSDVNNEKYVLFSDPALRLASPERKGQISSINPQVFQAMGRVSYTGVTDTSLASGARAAVTVYDTPTPVTRAFTINSSGTLGHISYVLPGKRIFRGLISVNDQDFSGAFTLPKDIKYSGEGGVLRVQYWDDTGLDGSIYLDTLQFHGTDSTALDNQGPQILFISDNMMLLNGDHFSANEPLEIELEDAQGINLTGAAGHGISLAIDEDWENAYDLTELFEYDLDHSDLGRLSAYLTEIKPGEHYISIKAWDSQNNPNDANVRLEFFAAGDFRVYDLYNFPNPMGQNTDITYMLSHPATVTAAVYTLAGRKVMHRSLGLQSQGFNSLPWDGRDNFGNQLANGVYVLAITAESDDFTQPAQTLQKLVIAR